MGTLVKNNRSVFPAMPALFDDLLTKDLLSWPFTNRHASESVPAINIKETAEAFNLEVAAPGMAKDDFKVQLDNDLLIISAEKENRQEEKDQQGEYTRREFSYQSFVRTFNLPENLVKGNEIAAKYQDGILSVSIPKTEKATKKEVKQIDIS